MNKLRPSREALMEVFQTPRPSIATISRWKSSWKFKSGRVRVDNYTTAMKMLSRMPDIDPLFYQIATDEVPSSVSAGTYIVFFKPEHEAYFKLHQHLG